MRTALVTCDGCGCGVGRKGYGLEYGRHDCVTARADLCDACISKLEQAIGVTWNMLRERNKQENK